MKGQSLADMKLAAVSAIRALPPSAHFNLVSYGSWYEFLFPEISVLANEANKDKAIEYIKLSKANMGGTDLWKVLRAVEALSYEYHPVTVSSSLLGHQHPIQLMLFTDGYVSEEDLTVRLVKKANCTQQIYLG